MITEILTLMCPDQKGIIATISNILYIHGANIITADQYSSDPEEGHFFLRLSYCYNDTNNTSQVLHNTIKKTVSELDGTHQIKSINQMYRMGILASKTDHCVEELLYQWRSGTLKVKIPFIISNHETLKPIAKQNNIPFHYIPASRADRKEAQILHIIKPESDFIVLARYMQILSADFLASYEKDIINIHHSFLPSFKGANPYQQAFNRGVKQVGTTAHYATEDLDEGPIIGQWITAVSHKDTVSILKEKGKHLEKFGLAEAARLHSENRILRHRNKTIVFK